MPDSNYPVPFEERYTATDDHAPRRYLVGLFDVLGFTSRLSTSPLTAVAEEYRQLKRHLVWSTDQPLFVMSPTNPRAIRWNTRNAVYSDTIVLWSTLEQENVTFFLSSCSILMEVASKAGWPLRGAIAAGECVIHQGDGLFLGQPIIRALDLEKAQDWIGVGIDTLCADDPVCGDSVRQHVDVREYHVPVKPGSPAIEWAVTWHERDPDSTAAIRHMMERAPRNHAARYEATIAFLRKGRR